MSAWGFEWEQVKVERWIDLGDGRKVLRVATDHDQLDIYVSRTGRSVRVFRPGKGELVAESSAQPVD